MASSLQHGADPTKKNRDGNTPLDLVKDGDTDIQDLLRGDAALLDAAKKGCLARVQKLCSPDNINCRDTQGRNSTPLHLAGNESTHTHSQGETIISPIKSAGINLPYFFTLFIYN